MSDFLPSTVINDQKNPHALLFPSNKGRGLIPRDYGKYPVGSYRGVPPMRAVDMPLIPRDQWSARLAELVAKKSRISDIRRRADNGQPMPALDQGQVGYCWAHSTTGAVMLIHALANDPYKPLSAYAVAATIKKGADEGGWGALSLEFAMDRGIPTQKMWPQGDRNYKSYDKPEVWADAKLNLVTEGWVDLEAQAYDRQLTFDQTITLLLSLVPVVGDFNWWGHSVCLMDAIDGATHRNATRDDSGKLLSTSDFDAFWGMNNPVTGGWGTRILNSWSNTWGDLGEGPLAGSKAVPDGGVAARVVSAAG